MKDTEIKKSVREGYAKIAKEGGSCCDNTHQGLRLQQQSICDRYQQEHRLLRRGCKCRAGWG